MTDDESQFIESLMQQIERASQDKRDVLNSKLRKLDQRLLQEDQHISDLIETIIDRARKREENTIEQLEELRSLVSHRVQISPPPLPSEAEIAERFAPERETFRQVVNDSYPWAN